MTKLTYLIVGRTASGKSTFERALSKVFGFKPLLSYTTRPKRDDKDNTHIFITEQEYRAFPEDEIAAYTEINGYHYFATKEQVRECDTYVIDPNGLHQLLSRMPDEKFVIIYNHISKSDSHLNYILRADTCYDDESFYGRWSAESEMFDEFEDFINEEISTLKQKYYNLVDVRINYNDSISEWINNFIRYKRNFLELMDGVSYIYHLIYSKPLRFVNLIDGNQNPMDVICDDILINSNTKQARYFRTYKDEHGNTVVDYGKHNAFYIISTDPHLQRKYK